MTSYIVTVAVLSFFAAIAGFLTGVSLILWIFPVVRQVMNLHTQLGAALITFV